MKLFKMPYLVVWLAMLASLPAGCLSGPDDEPLDDLEFNTAAISVSAVANPNGPQCKVTDIAHFIAGGSNSFGVCQGECQFNFETQMPEDGGCATASLDVCGWGVSGCTRTNRGTFTPQGVNRLQALAMALSKQRLQNIYGCPGCTDGGTAQLMLSMDDVPMTVSYEYGNPPEILAEANGFTTSVITALNTCVSNEYIEIDSGDCTPSAN